MKVKKWFAVLLICAAICSLGQMQAANPLFAVIVDGKSGYIDGQGKIVIPPRFEATYGFDEGTGLAAIKVGDKYGFIDKTGAIKIPPIYDEVSFFSFFDGLALVRVGKEWYYIDAAGNQPFYPPGSCWIPFSEGLAPFANDDDKVGFMDRAGNVVIAPQYDNACFFCEGYAWVDIGGKFGFIDRTGNLVVKPNYDDTGDFSEGLVFVANQDWYGYIGTEGTVRIDLAKIAGAVAFDNADDVVDYFANVWSEFKDGVVAYRQGKKYGYIDIHGNIIASCQYEEAFGCSEGLMAVRLNRRWGFLDTTGRVALPFIYDEVGPFENGLAPVTLDGKDAYIDKTGRVVWQSKE